MQKVQWRVTRDCTRSHPKLSSRRAAKHNKQMSHQLAGYAQVRIKMQRQQMRCARHEPWTLGCHDLITRLQRCSHRPPQLSSTSDQVSGGFLDPSRRKMRATVELINIAADERRTSYWGTVPPIFVFTRQADKLWLERMHRASNRHALRHSLQATTSDQVIIPPSGKLLASGQSLAAAGRGRLAILINVPRRADQSHGHREGTEVHDEIRLRADQPWAPA